MPRSGGVKMTKAQRIKSRQARIDALLDKVYTTELELVRDCADRWTTENLGQTWPDVNWRFEDMTDGIDESEKDDFSRGLNAEFRSWVVDANKHLKVIKKHKLALTMRNMELSFDHKLPGQKSCLYGGKYHKTAKVVTKMPAEATFAEVAQPAKKPWTVAAAKKRNPKALTKAVR